MQAMLALLALPALLALLASLALLALPAQPASSPAAPVRSAKSWCSPCVTHLPVPRLGGHWHHKGGCRLHNPLCGLLPASQLFRECTHLLDKRRNILAKPALTVHISLIAPASWPAWTTPAASAGQVKHLHGPEGLRWPEKLIVYCNLYYTILVVY